jgi:hypothetical protein
MVFRESYEEEGEGGEEKAINACIGWSEKDQVKIAWWTYY